MVRLAADENFNNDILRLVWRLAPHVDIIRIQDTEIRGADDPQVLQWLAKENRVLLTHDVNTIPAFAFERVQTGLAMPGVFIVHQNVSIALVAQDIVLIAECSEPEEWDKQVCYLPLR